MRVEQPCLANGMMSLPRELHVRDGRLYSKPVSEVYRELLGERLAVHGDGGDMVVTAPGNAYYANVHLADDADAIMVLAKGVNPQDGRPTELLLQRTDGVTRLVAKGTAVEDVDFDSGITDVRQVEVFFDRNVVEVFLNGGQTAGSMLFQGADGDGELRIASSGKIDAVDARALNGIWR
ncbi:MAG: hypothetical protein V9G11_05785 [Bifidobacterium adolescentis]